MSYSEFSYFSGPIGIIIIGIAMKVSKNKEKFGFIQKYWVLLIIMGLFSLIYRLYKLLYVYP